MTDEEFPAELSGSLEQYLFIAAGLDPKRSLIHKFGAADLTTSIGPVTQSGIYKTPLAAVALEFVSDDENDTAAGSGAQEITILGLDSNWNHVVQTLETDGLNPVALNTNLTRLFRWYVSRSGTYATQEIGSHQGVLTIQEDGGGDLWTEIPITPFPIGQSQIGVYTIPIGFNAYLLGKNVFTDTNLKADVYFFQRAKANDVSPPYSGGMRLIEREVGISGGFALQTVAPKGPFVGPCDIGFMGLVSASTAKTSVEFELLLVANN